MTTRLPVVSALILLPVAGGAQPFGIDLPRQSNETVIVRNLPTDPGGFELFEPFPTVSFSEPISAKPANDGTNRMFVIERAGRIRVFDADLASPTVSTFLDIRSRVLSTGGEQGLLDIAFHPNFPTNGFVYVHYSDIPGSGDTTISRFTVSNPASGTADPNSELVLLKVDQPFTNHNGGAIHFGRDGYLYIALGDGGSGNDPRDDAQNMSVLLGKMLRIDVDNPSGGRNYGIPADNPFLFPGGGPSEVIIESRQPNGTVTPSDQGYFEVSGNLQNSTNKSTATGLTGSGTRVSDNTQLNARVRFSADLSPGLYEVYVTVPGVGGAQAANADNTTYILNAGGKVMTFRARLIPSQAGNRWLRLRRNFLVTEGTETSLELAETSPQGGNFYADAVRFVRVTPQPEIYAFGLRNPWRFSFDRVDGRGWIGDVGQNSREEINVLRAGANYGWRDREGTICTPAINSGVCDPTGYDEPVKDYVHTLGRSITGGYVYRGTQFPELYGAYLYTDATSSRIWALRRDFETNTNSLDRELLNPNLGFGLVSFAEFENGELLIVNNSSGRLLSLRRTGTPVVSDLPTRLSDRPAFLRVARGEAEPGIVPYAPQVPFWSDGARKLRFVALPQLGQAGYTATGSYTFPEDSVLVKSFRLPLVDNDPGSEILIETRLMIREAGQWRGFSYRWNDQQTDAVLLTSSDTRTVSITPAGGGAARPYTWYFPSSTDCIRCHTPASGGALGVQTVQLNSRFFYPVSMVEDNQLRTWDHISLLNPPIPAPSAELPSMPKINDTSASLLQRTKAYLQANCANCHLPGGGTPAAMDLRWETALDSMGIVSATPQNGDIGIDGALIVDPGRPATSLLYRRMTTLDPDFRMPPIGSSRVDEEGTALIREWIESLNPPSEASGWFLY